MPIRPQPAPAFDSAAAWDRVSATYQRRNQISTTEVEYGPWSPPESVLQLLGDVRGLQVLEIGCGGGQACVALAKQGAQVTGLDISSQQLAFAAQQAAAAQVNIQFLLGSSARLAELPPNSLDLVLSIYALQYIPDLAECLSACQRGLRPGGRILFSIDHPMRDCFFDQAEQELTPYPSRSYFDPTPLRWRFPDTSVTLQTYHYTMSQWVAMVHDAGFAIERLVEPLPPPELLQTLWPEDDPLFSMRNLPQTIIFIANKSHTLLQR